MQKDHVTEAIELFRSGFHCSQAVLGAFCEEFGLDRETALKISCPFGGGMGGYGRTCGALTGAMMVIGLKHGATHATDSEARKFSREKTRELMERFELEYGTSLCNELVGFDRSNSSAAELMANRQLFYATCPKYLETVIAFLEEEI